MEAEGDAGARVAWRRLGAPPKAKLNQTDLRVALLRALGFNKALISRLIERDEKIVDQRLAKISKALVGVVPDRAISRVSSRFGLEDLLREAGLPLSVIADVPEGALGVLDFLARALQAAHAGEDVAAEDLLEMLGWPGVLLQGDCREEYRAAPWGHAAGQDDIKFVPEPNAHVGYRGPPELQDDLRRLCDLRWNAAESANKEIHNRPFDVTPAGGKGASAPRRIRASDYVPNIVEHSQRPGVNEGRTFEIRYQSTWYWYAMGTNFALDHPGRGDLPLDHAEKADISRLDLSILANPASANIAVILEEPRISRDTRSRRWVLIQERGPKSASNTASDFKYQISGAGFVDVEDWRTGQSGGPPNAWVAGARETREESGLDVSPEDITFLGLARDRVKYEVGLFGFARKTGTPQSVKVRPPKERSGEVSALRWWPWEPRAVLLKLSEVGNGSVQSGVRRFLPLGAIALLGSLIHDFGDEVDVALRGLEGQAPR